MASNHFGNLFKITTWGESHGKAMGVVIDGCPPGLVLNEKIIQKALDERRPGTSAYVSPRVETDQAEIYSGVFEGKTTGAPISIIIPNRDADSSAYESTKDLYKPGHANFTYLKKYDCFDYRGGGRASARETVCRVAAGAVAGQLLQQYQIDVQACIQQIGTIKVAVDEISVNRMKESLIFCPDETVEEALLALLTKTKQQGDSLGGCVACQVTLMPAGLGDPVYEKLEANLAKAMLSIPASKGFEIGRGFDAVGDLGSQHNDAFMKGHQPCETNHAGGTLGGISTGMPLRFSVVFKPTSSILKPQKTVNFEGEEKIFEQPAHARHDPCVAIRAVPVVKAMCQLVLADALLMNKIIRL